MKPARTTTDLIKETVNDETVELEYLEIKIERTMDGVAATDIKETGAVLTIVYPLDPEKNTENVTVYRVHGEGDDAKVEMFKKVNSATEKADARFLLEEGYVHIYANQFSTYAIGYTAADDPPPPRRPAPAAATSRPPIRPSLPRRKTAACPCLPHPPPAAVP